MSGAPSDNRQDLRGIGVSSGLGLGRARVMSPGGLQIPHLHIGEQSCEEEVARLMKAIASVDRELDLMTRRSPRKAPKEVKALLEVFRLLVNDATLLSESTRIIREQLVNAEWALDIHLEEVRKAFEDLSDTYLAQRFEDIGHVVSRLQEELTGGRRLREEVRNVEEEVILVTHDLSLADIIWLTEYEELDLVGIITEKGGRTSHTAVLAQTLFIPAIVGVSGASSLIRNNDMIFVDSLSGEIICNPTTEELKSINDRVKVQERLYSKRFRARRRVAETVDGFRLTLKANIAMVSGLDEILHLGAQGVGLYRTEYLFMGRDALPTEEEQYLSYRQLIDSVAPRSVTIRTIDVGGDKILKQESDSAGKEENPALGLRAVRFTLANPNLFLIQLRAILRAAADRNVRILLPLVSSLQELREAKRYIELAKSQLKEEGLTYNEDVEVGIMVELPATAICSESFIEEVDFISIGTNDLIQYTLGVDRGNCLVAPLYDELHPAVLKLIAMCATVAQKYGKPLSVCGEMGGKSRLSPIFIGMGIKELSMAPMLIPEAKEVIRNIKKSACVRLVRKVLKARDSLEARELLDEFFEKEKLCPTK